MAYKMILKDDIDTKLNELEYEITGEMTLRELYAALIARYCHPIRRFDQLNNLLGTGYYQRYWKVKGIERAARKRAGESATLIPTEDAYVEEGLEGKVFIDLVDDYVIRNSKDCNTPCENILRENILSRIKNFYMDILTGLYSSLKKEDVDLHVAYKSDLKDFMEDIFESEEIKDLEITDEIKELLNKVINVFIGGKSEFVKNFLLEEASFLLFDRHSIGMEEKAVDVITGEPIEGTDEVNVIVERLRQAYVVISDLMYVSDMTYTAFVELVYAGLYKITEGDKEKMLALVEAEIEENKKEMNLREEDGMLILDEKVFKNVNEIADTKLNALVNEVLA